MSNFYNGKTRQGTKTQLQFPTLPSLTQQPIKYTLIEEEHKHDILEIWASTNFEAWISLLKTGVPVEFRITQGVLSRTWIGYVSYVKSTVSAQREREMVVVCIGSSFPLKEETTETYEKVTIPDVVEKIATKFGYNYLGEQHGLVFDQLSLAGHSYWEWIHEQAKRIGYGVLIDGMTMVFKPIDSMIKYGITTIPLFDMGGIGIPSGSNFIDRTLDSFQVLNGEHIETPEATRTTKVMGSVDPITGAMGVTIQSPATVGKSLRTNVSDVLFSEYRSDQVAHSYTQASMLAEGAAHRGRMNMPAYVTGQGDPRIRVFCPILVTGTTDQTDGYWVVKKARHVLSRNGNYEVEMLVAADGTGVVSQTYSSQASTEIVGMVNLSEALNNGGQNINLTASNSYALVTPKGVTTELGQGFLRTQARWTYSPIGGKS